MRSCTLQCCRWMKVCGSGQIPISLGLLAHSALARNASAHAWEGFSKYAVCVGQIVDSYFAQNSAGFETACIRRGHRSGVGSGERGRCVYIKSVATLPNMRPWRPINEPAWPFRSGEATQEFTEDSAPDGGTVSKDGSPHLSRRHVARRTATGTETKPVAPRRFMDGSLACAGPMELLMQ